MKTGNIQIVIDGDMISKWEAVSPELIDEIEKLIENPFKELYLIVRKIEIKKEDE